MQCLFTVASEIYTCGNEHSLSRFDRTLDALFNHVPKKHLTLPHRRYPLLILHKVLFSWFNKVKHFLALEIK